MKDKKLDFENILVKGSEAQSEVIENRMILKTFINSEELNVTSHRRLWNGSALVILRAGKTPSKVTLKTTSGAYKTIITKLTTQ